MVCSQTLCNQKGGKSIDFDYGTVTSIKKSVTNCLTQIFPTGDVGNIKKGNGGASKAICNNNICVNQRGQKTTACPNQGYACSSHISDRNDVCHPQGRTIAPRSHSVWTTIFKVGDRVPYDFFSEAILALQTELKIRSISVPTWNAFPKGSRTSRGTYNQLCNSIDAVNSHDRSGSLANNKVTWKDHSVGVRNSLAFLNQIRLAIHTDQSVCVCQCNYCTCNCDYCTCDCNYCTCHCDYCTCHCNYTCTCQCNYSDKRLKENIKYI